MVIQLAEVINLPFFFFFPPIGCNWELTHPSSWCRSGNVHKYSVGGCHGREKDGAEKLMQQTKGTDFKRGHCGDSKFLIDIADTYCAEITVLTFSGK